MVPAPDCRLRGKGRNRRPPESSSQTPRRNPLIAESAVCANRARIGAMRVRGAASGPLLSLARSIRSRASALHLILLVPGQVGGAELLGRIVIAETVLANY